MHTLSVTPIEYEHIRLSGVWEVEPRPLAEAFRPGKPETETVSVPECAHLQPILYPDQPYWGEHLRAINRQAWVYRRGLTRPEGAYQRARLRFEAVDYFAQVWIDGQFIGEHEGGFSPFELTLPPADPGIESLLTVRVTSPWDEPEPRGTYPIDHVKRGLIKGLYEHGEGVIPPDVNPLGIWQPIWLLLDQGISLDRVQIRTRLDGVIDLALHLTNATRTTWDGSLSLDVEAENHGGLGVGVRRVLRLPPGTHLIEQRLSVADPHWWWPWDHGEANLYRLNARLVDRTGQMVGGVEKTFGIRTVRLDRAPDRFTYWINERPISIRGASYMPGLYLSQCDEAGLSHDVMLARQANLNLLRAHVHVAPPAFYDQCDRAGMMVWQDFELNWTQDDSLDFEQRALKLQREMMDMLDHHPSVMTWACHNEPTMVLKRRHNLERHPDAALYADALSNDSTRPVFICSGQLDDDWERSGDTHSYYGAIWTHRYTDVYRHRARLCTEFGFEAPAAEETLRAYPETWERLRHLEHQIAPLWNYQAALIQYQVEHFRHLRSNGCGGYVMFWLTDLVPQVGCGVLDSARIPKGGYDALKHASLPLLMTLEHDGHKPVALWVVNDTSVGYDGAVARWRVEDANGQPIYASEMVVTVAANESRPITPANWPVKANECITVHLTLHGRSGELLCENHYDRPFQHRQRPAGYPWKFDPVLGTKVFDRPGALSMVDRNSSGMMRYVPLAWRERGAERVMQLKLPRWLASAIAHVVDQLIG